MIEFRGGRSISALARPPPISQRRGEPAPPGTASSGCAMSLFKKAGRNYIVDMFISFVGKFPRALILILFNFG